ncbi:hypothetical protein HDV02_003271, partial [Globomyces sp. JEL0801]
MVTLDPIGEIVGITMSAIGAGWLLRKNNMPNNVYNSLLKTLCYVWLVNFAIVVTLFITYLYQHKICEVDTIECSKPVRVLAGFKSATLYFTLLMTFVLCVIPWYLIRQGGSVDDIHPKSIVVSVSVFSILPLASAIDAIPSEIITIIDVVMIGLFFFVLLPGMIYCSYTTWSSLRHDSKSRQAQQTLGSFQFNEDKKHTGSQLISQLSLLLSISITASIVPFILFIFVDLAVDPEGSNCLDSQSCPHAFKIIAFFIYTIVNAYGAFFSVGVYFLFRNIAKYNIRRDAAIRLKELQAQQQAPQQMAADSGIDRDQSDILQPMTAALSVSDDQMDFAVDMSMSRDFGQI